LNRQGDIMNHVKRPVLIVLIATFFGLAVLPAPASAGQRFIVRKQTGLLCGLPLLSSVLSLAGFTLQYPLDGTIGQVYLTTTQSTANPNFLIALLQSLTCVSTAEVDQVVHAQAAGAGSPPPALTDTTPVNYYGVSVREGYVDQPAATIVGLSGVQSKYGLTGNGATVAVIDTGVDPSQPVLSGVLTPGYDFTRNKNGGSEMADVNQSTVAVVDGASPAYVNQSTIACVDQSTVAVVDDNGHAAFGHGTMVAGVVHLVAPHARIMPLKAFAADGSGYASDVLRAIYYAVQNNAKVINMSFSFTSSSNEVANAVRNAQSKGVVTVASAGNDGQQIVVYPAGLPSVIGVASTTDSDGISTFSNFGTQVAFIAAPGEGVVTTYPWGAWAAAWGTSFSAPFASGTAALLVEVSQGVTDAQAASAESHAVLISSEIKYGRLDIGAAVAAYRASLGLQ
jgi:subtilisin family serine protease